MAPRILPPDEALPHRLAAALRIGEIVAVPTDTTYALVTALSSKKGVTRLREIRHLGPDRPVTLLLPDLTDISRWANLDRSAYRMIRRLAPGPFTFLLPATREVGKFAETKRQTIGIRIPDNSFLHDLAKQCGGPLASASASRPRGEGEEGGNRYLTEAAEIARVYPEIAAIVDFGHIPPESSTIVDLTGGETVIVRQGAGRVE